MTGADSSGYLLGGRPTRVLLFGGGPVLFPRHNLGVGLAFGGPGGVGGAPALAALALAALALLCSAGPAAAPGDLDPTFGGDGRVTGLGAGPVGAQALVRYPGDRVVAVGTYDVNQPGDFVVVRYGPDGPQDGSFDGDGRATTDFLGGYDEANDAAVGPDGRVVVAGIARDGRYGDHDFAVARYEPDGGLDAAFAPGGKAATDFGSAGESVSSVAVLPDGKIVAAGGYGSHPRVTFALARYRGGGSDAAAPTVAISSPADGATYAQGQSVDAAYSCADETGGSGVKGCEGTAPSGSAVDTSAPGRKSFAVTATDNTGNARTVTHSYTVAVHKTYQESDRDRAGYGSWSYHADPGSSDGYSARSDAKDDSATFRFTGTSVQWKTAKTPDGGVTAVYLDGARVGTFDGYSATPLRDVTGFAKRRLADKKHTLKLVVTGTKNAASACTRTEIDRFMTDAGSFQDDHPSVALGPWKGASSAGASGSSYRAGASTTQGVSFRGFTGPYVELVTATGPKYGRAEIRIFDARTDALVGTFTPDLGAPAVRWRVPVRVGLPDPTREYYLRVTSADGRPVVVDAYNAFITDGGASPGAQRAPAAAAGGREALGLGERTPRSP